METQQRTKRATKFLSLFFFSFGDRETHTHIISSHPQRDSKRGERESNLVAHFFKCFKCLEAAAWAGPGQNQQPGTQPRSFTGWKTSIALSHHA